MELRLLRYLAVRNGFSLNYISKDEKISMLLSQLHTIFENDVVLKGGTGLNRVYIAQHQASRFSEDIDLDYLVEDKLNTKISKIKAEMANIEDFNVQGPRLLHRTLRFDCYYMNELDTKDRVMVEFYLTTHPYHSIANVLVKSPFVDAYPTIFNVYSIEDFLARKMITLYNRLQGKDIYDVYFGLKTSFQYEDLSHILQRLLKFYKIKGDFFPALSAKLEVILEKSNYIRNSTNHFIPKALRFNWEETIRTLLEDLERQFL